MTVLWVGLFGAVGSIARWGLGGLAQRLFARFPGGTLTVNLLGSAAIGFVMTVFALRGQVDSRLRVALTAGFLGGFTTYSAFAYDSLALLDRGQTAGFALYLAATVVGCLLACWGGVALARALG